MTESFNHIYRHMWLGSTGVEGPQAGPWCWGRRVVLPRGAGVWAEGQQGEDKQLAGANCPPLGSAGL